MENTNHTQQDAGTPAMGLMMELDGAHCKPLCQQRVGCGMLVATDNKNGRFLNWV